MVDITFYTFEKRRNSTKQPPADAGTVVQCDFKSQVQIDAPIFMVEWESVPQWNYCKMFSNFYYITDITIVRDKLYLVRCVIDELASGKADIGNTEAYILYSASKYTQLAQDNRLCILPYGDWNENKITFYPPLSLIGTFVLSAVGKGENTYNFTTGMCRSYFMDYTQMQAFVNNFTSTDVWTTLKQYFSNPIDAIADMYWLPVPIDTLTDTIATTVKLGEYDTGVSAKCLKNPLMTSKAIGKNLTIPWKYDDFRRCSEWTRLLMFHPLIGLTELNATEWFLEDSITCDTYIDFISGAVTVELKSDIGSDAGRVKHQVLSGNCRVNLPYGRTDSRIGQLIGSLGNIGNAQLSIATGNATGAVGNLAGALTQFAKPIGSSVNGSFSGSYIPVIADTNIHMYVYSYEGTAEPEAVAPIMGRPFFQVDKIGNHSGFIQTQDASVSASFEAPIIDRINAALNGGIFYE